MDKASILSTLSFPDAEADEEADNGAVDILT